MDNLSDMHKQPSSPSATDDHSRLKEETQNRYRSKKSGSSLGIGEIKWFGGTNGKTGRENDYGFIATPSGDLFFHRSDSISPTETLIEGAKVSFLNIEGRKGKAAGSVSVLSRMDDVDLSALVDGFHSLQPEDVLTVASHMKAIGPIENEVFCAVGALASVRPEPLSVAAFWEKFDPASPKDRLLAIAPDSVKSRFYKQHFSAFRESLNGLFSSITDANTTLRADDVYRDLDERDVEIAKEWAGKDNDAVMAKMLSARAAEKATRKFYEAVGATVEDVSIRQLERQSTEWTTHDLLVDSSIPVDVKNARRPVSRANFYVEHTIPRFKLDRRNKHVRIAGVLSPYLQLDYIQNPSKAGFEIEDLIFLGETSRNKIDQLISAFGSNTFEVTRVDERTVPNWVFAYPYAWYRVFSDNIRHFVGGCGWPDGNEWKYVLSDSEQMAAIPALCVTGKPLPAVISSRLAAWQTNFYSRLQSLIGNVPEMPVIFFAVLTDFLQRLKDGETDFSPDGYKTLLFVTSSRINPGHSVSYPLGAIDPLGLVNGLVQTLSTLWKNRGDLNLDRFTNFRFSGLGILQGRERERNVWNTIIAYCGGTAYRMDDSGNVVLGPDGKPVGVNGKCGNFPLVIGDSATCPTCGKLICKKCGFCCPPCQDRLFAERAKAEREKLESRTLSQPQRQAAPGSDEESNEDSRWVKVPLDAYEDDFRRW